MVCDVRMCDGMCDGQNVWWLECAMVKCVMVKYIMVCDVRMRALCVIC